MSGANLYEQALAMFLSQAKPPVPRPPRASTSVIPWRYGPDGRVQVYWIQRALQLGFLGGWHAFPGGALAKSDATVTVQGDPILTGDVGAEHGYFGSHFMLGEKHPPTFIPGLLACAVRELFEETGIPLFTGNFPSASALEQMRQRLLNEEASLDAVLSGHHLAADATRLVFAGRWITPIVSPMRFDVRFFLLRWDESEPIQPIVHTGEIAAGEWIAAEEAVAEWYAHRVFAAPPTMYILEALAELGPEKGLPRLHRLEQNLAEPLKRFLDTRPGVISLPLITPTLPPAQVTNSFVLGAEEVVLVDVGSPFDIELERLEQVLGMFEAHMGKRVVAIWLTHHHPDHVGGVERMRQRLGVPVCAHPLTAARLASQGVTVDRELLGGEEIVLAGDPPCRVRVLHTPGHTRGHLCFLEMEHGSLIAGDLVAGTGTVVIDPPEGNMNDYLQSLEYLASLQPRTLFPSHGPASSRAVEKLQDYIAHRLRREEMIFECYSGGVTLPSAMVAKVYADTPPQLHPIAERQLLAHLQRLRHLGRIE